MGYPVFADDLKVMDLNKKSVVNTINQYSYCVAEKDPAFKAALKASDILLPDGVGITIAAKILLGEKVKKIAGADLHAHLLEQMNEKNGSCFYLGASQTTLEKIGQRLATEYPNIRVGSFSPPFKAKFTAEDNERMIREVNTFAPDVLFIGMTAPKQEKWSLEHKDSLNVKGPICAIGAVFDFYAGTVKRPGKVWRDLGLEWLGRLLKEPKRMWKRYIYNGAVFGGYLLKEKFLSKSAPEQG
ncbi:WecB/TagA/CpsF family glycosyltransferase [Maribacter sp. RZ05]|uniref:WecB/TagA/CpsF family glycosyltransferase n=2 Tax=Maribacter luteus TaxID=2594478 RepID=A0A6I2MHZ3_9FLAO|nr:WecB/TagA/CpsF family glycosyltransferase [Maribacter luteus]